MNYRHHFHAGNFADVMKHALLLQLMRALQRKERGFLVLDTHAGRGGYDLAVAGSGDSLARKPEWPEGIGRLWHLRGEPVPAALAEYLELVRDFDREQGNLADEPRFYPGSPWIARRMARAVDRLALCEKHPEECAALRAEFAGVKGTSVHAMDGYGSLRAMLPPPERRALVLIDPPFEAADEFAHVIAAVREGLQRFPSCVLAIWYPLTGRARVEEFFTAVRLLQPPPVLACELTVAGEASALKMKGCGLLLVNPPWRIEIEAASLLDALAVRLAQAPGGVGRVGWVVRESPRRATAQSDLSD